MIDRPFADAETIAFMRSRSASEILADLGSLLREDRISLGDIVDALGEAGLGLTILMLALPSFIPVPGVPLGVVFGTALALLSVQVMIGAQRLILPQQLRRVSLPRGPVIAGGRFVAPWFRQAERMLRPGLPLLSSRMAHLVVAAPIFVHAVMIILPIPLGNQLPALAVIAFAFGLIERDGLAILAGAVLSVVAVAWNTAIILFGAELGRLAFGFAADFWGRI